MFDHIFIVSQSQHLTFPGYVSNILETCIDEACVNLGVEALNSSVSRDQAPTSKWLHIIMSRFLLVSYICGQILKLVGGKTC